MYRYHPHCRRRREAWARGAGCDHRERHGYGQRWTRRKGEEGNDERQAPGGVKDEGSFNNLKGQVCGGLIYAFDAT